MGTKPALHFPGHSHETKHDMFGLKIQESAFLMPLRYLVQKIDDSKQQRACAQHEIVIATESTPEFWLYRLSGSLMGTAVAKYSLKVLLFILQTMI